MLANLFKDNVVLKANEPFTVRGYSRPFSSVTVELVGVESKTVTVGEDGRFETELGAVEGGFTPYVLRYLGEDGEQAVSNVRFGMVFLTAGQSNMEYTLATCIGGMDRIRDLHDRIAVMRIVNMTRNADGHVLRPFDPVEDVHPDCRYLTADDSEIAERTAIGAVFAAAMSERYSLPVGIIDTSVGGCPLHSYISRDTILRDEGLMQRFTEAGVPTDPAKYNLYGELNIHQIYGIYNETIAPLRGVGFDAMLWYQGESEVMGVNWHDYARTFGLMVEDVRAVVGDIPVIASGIADCYYGIPNGSQLLNVRLAAASDSIEDVYYVPIYDIKPLYNMPGAYIDWLHPIHPTQKRPVAERMARLMYRLVDGEGGVYLAPTVKKARKGFHVTLKERIAVKRGGFRGFYIQDGEGRFYSADTKRISPYTLLVYSEYVDRPTGVGYACFGANEWCDVMTESGFPMAEFEHGIEGVYTPYVALDCTVAEVRNNLWMPYNGGLASAPAWRLGGMMDNTDSRLRMVGVRPEITHTVTSHERSRYFSLAPEINVVRGALVPENYPYLYVEVTVTGDEVDFCGVHTAESDGTFRHYTEVSGAQCHRIPEGRSVLKVDLTVPYDPWDNKLYRSEQAVRAFELAFGSVSSATVRIESVRFGNK